MRRNLRNLHQCEIPANTVATNPKAISVKPSRFALVCIWIASGVWAFSRTVWKNATVPDPKLATVKEFQIQAKVVRSSANCVLNFGILARLLASQRCRHTWLLIHPESAPNDSFPFNSETKIVLPHLVTKFFSSTRSPGNKTLPPVAPSPDLAAASNPAETSQECVPKYGSSPTHNGCPERPRPLNQPISKTGHPRHPHWQLILFGFSQLWP